MAPKVLVPADFGRHHIGAPSHGNLTFNLGEGVEKVKANSIILSLNSPVIDRLTSDLSLTSLEAEDFNKQAVDCFIEACYTGEAEALNLDNFRHVNKMSHVFQVDWLNIRCQQYFVKYVDDLGSASSYSDIFFAVSEALYVFSALKKKDFYSVVLKKLSSAPVLQRNAFVSQYLSDQYFSDLASSTKLQLDFCLAVVQSDVHVLTESLTKHLEEKGYGSFGENCRYFLTQIDLKNCEGGIFYNHSKLLSALNNPERCSDDDIELLVNLCKQNSVHCRNLWPIRLNLISFAKYFNDNNMDSAIMLEKLASRPEEASIYILFDALWSAVTCHSRALPYYGGKNLLEYIIAVKEERGWSQLNECYLQRIYGVMSRVKDFIKDIRGSSELVSKDTELNTAIICEYPASKFEKEIFRSNSDIRFVIGGEQFVLSITCAKYNEPDNFSAKVSPLGRRLNLHFALEIQKGCYNCCSKFETSFKCIKGWHIFPITWFGPPTCADADKYWNWGNVCFHKQSNDYFYGQRTKFLVDNNRIYLTKNGYRPSTEQNDYQVTDETLCRLVVFEID